MSEETLVEHVALIGLSGAGKSVVAELLARRLGCASLDLDRTVERRAGLTVATIFATEGEERFRELESRALAEALGGSDPRVIACGGGVLGRDRNRGLLKSRARVVWLEVDPDEAAIRLRTSEEERPLLRGGATAERLRDLLRRRGAQYEAVADLRVTTDRLAPEEVAARIAGWLGAPER